MQLRPKDGTVIVDGPYSESKKAMHGYFIFQAKDMDEAVTIARDCPALTHGETVDVYQLS